MSLLLAFQAAPPVPKPPVLPLRGTPQSLVEIPVSEILTVTPTRQAVLTLRNTLPDLETFRASLSILPVVPFVPPPSPPIFPLRGLPLDLEQFKASLSIFPVSPFVPPPGAGPYRPYWPMVVMRQRSYRTR